MRHRRRLVACAAELAVRTHWSEKDIKSLSLHSLYEYLELTNVP
ncbi:MAG: hypothetical protein A4E66_00012 [Syntrophus sp. PtaB.Bin001]|nr:MAG: hypothetical protein A4E66_00012 [Syntrophus sp. PtaB.Bin001]